MVTIFLGLQKVAVLAGYKIMKEAPINHAEEFGDREPFRIVINYAVSKIICSVWQTKPFNLSDQVQEQMNRVIGSC